MPDLMPAWHDGVVQHLAATRCCPESASRVQLHAGCTCRDALEIVPYLHALGITHGYAAPF